MNFKTIWTLIRETFQDWSEDKAPRLAAALSYYTIFSLAPLLVLVIAITGFVVGNNETIRSQLIGQVQSMAGQQAGEAVNTLIDNTSKPRTGILATVIGIATLLLGATGVFGQLKDALNTIWEVEPEKGGGIWKMIKDRFLSFTMVLGISFLLLVSLVISAALAVVNQYFTNMVGGAGIIASVINFVISIGVVTLIFALIFKVLPDVEIAWSDVWIGALVTAVLFGIGRSLISLYLASAASTSAYGAAGSLVVILLWVYYSAQILFMGAEFTQVYARLHGSRIMPSENAREVTAGERANQGMTGGKREKAAARGSSAGVASTGGASTGGAVTGGAVTGGSRGGLTVEHIQPAMVPIPVAGQPAIHAPLAEERVRVRYEAPNPAPVIPVITLGAAAGVFTVVRIIRRLLDY